MSFKDIPVGTNLFAYCNNDSINHVDYDGKFRIRRWMIAMPIDMILMATPAGPLFAPIKYAGKKFGLAIVKTNYSGRLFKVISWLVKNIKKYVEKIIKALKNVKIIKNFRFIKNLNAKKITASFLGFSLFKVPVYKTLNLLIRNVDIVLSLGGFFAGMLDLCLDRSLNDTIWNI